MNRVDFMKQLESLLQNIASAEREEALQYYNDYFDDAGKENEQEVIEALGNPARVAENIKRDLIGGGGEGSVRKAQASDRALVEYGKDVQNSNGNQTSDDDQNSRGNQNGYDDQNSRGNQSSYDKQNNHGHYDSYRSQNSYDGQDNWNAQSKTADYDRTEWGGTSYSKDGNSTGNSQAASSSAAKSAGMPGWAIVLLVILMVFAFPVIIGLVSALFGLLVSWFAFIFGFGVAAVVLLIALCVLVVVGIMCFFVNPGAGMAVMGGGLICGAIGLLFLMLTVAMGGIVTPAIFKGIGYLIRLFSRKKGVK